MFTFRTLNRTVNSKLRSSANALAAALAVTLAIVSPQHAYADTAEELDVLRVDVPLDDNAFRNGELEISSLISENTYIDVDDFNLRAVELEAYTERDGEVRLKVGRYVTPPVPLPGNNEPGLLRIEAPHKTNKTWRLLIEDRVTINSLTAVLEPRTDNVSYYQSRYEQRGYAFGNDPYFRNNWSYQSRRDNWPYSWLRSDYDYNRRAGHWLWLNDSRSRFRLNPSYGFGHQHTRNCYDRFGRHLTFGGRQRSHRYTNRGRTSRLNGARLDRARSNGDRTYLHERRQQPVTRSTRRDLPRANREPSQRAARDTQRLNQRRAQQQQQAQREQRERRARQQVEQQRRAQQIRSRDSRERRARAGAQQRELGNTPRESSRRESSRRDSGRSGNRRGVE